MEDWSQWYKVPDKSNVRGFAIRRYRTINGKKVWQRYPAKLIRSLSDDELLSVLNQLNATHQTTRRLRDQQFSYDHAFVNTRSIEAFHEFLQSQANDKDHIRALMNYLHTYGFAFFVNEKKLSDPSKWHLLSTQWGQWLEKKGLGARTIGQVVAVVNRYTNFLQERLYPDMPSIRKLSPIGRTKLKRMLLESEELGSFISDGVWIDCVKWFKINDPSVLPNVLLCEWYGLRLSESQGLDKTKFFNQYLLVNAQGSRVKDGKIICKPTKTSDARKVPHWNVDLRKAWEQVKLVEVMHPDTLGRRVNAGLLAFGHSSHDLRRRFITKALRKHNTRDVQLAAGHKSIMTTMGYAKDDREMQDQVADLD